MAGLSHVVAISGWNVAIVVALIASATRRLRERFGPILPAVVAVMAVSGYVVLVGCVAGRRTGGAHGRRSAGRAARRVTGARGIGPDGRRRGHAPRRADRRCGTSGFQLSALATAGLIVLAAPLEARLARWPAWIRTPVALTVAAQLATLPVLLATFEQVSLVAPLANVIVVPLIPAVMAGSAAAAVFGGLAAARSRAGRERRGRRGWRAGRPGCRSAP